MRIVPLEMAQEDVDLARLSAFLDKLCPVVKKFTKAESKVYADSEDQAPREAQEAMLNLADAKGNLIDLLFTLEADPEWLRRVKTFHAEDTIIRQSKRQMFKNKK